MLGTRMKGWWSVGLVLAAGALGACSSDTAAPAMTGRQPGILQLLAWGGPTPPAALQGGGAVRWTRSPDAADVAPPQVIEAPDTVVAGQPFRVTVYTVGPSGCWQPAGQDIATTGRVVDLKPWDTHSGSEICTGVLLFLAHESTVTLSSAGEWTLRVTGRRVRHVGWENLESLQPVQAEKTIYAR